LDAFGPPIIERLLYRPRPPRRRLRGAGGALVSGQVCPQCKTWTPGDLRGDGTVIVCRVCAARGCHVRLNAPPRRLRLVELPALLVVALVVFAAGCERAAPACQAPPGTACAVLSPSAPITTECPGPADDAGNLGCDANTEDGCICGARLDSGSASGACHAGACVAVDGGSQ
jgi:hypothetical protein